MNEKLKEILNNINEDERLLIVLSSGKEGDLIASALLKGNQLILGLLENSLKKLSSLKFKT